MKNIIINRHLLREGVNKPGFHQCGKDGEGNYLFLPIDVECPINEFIISFSPDLNSFKDEYNYYNYTTILFYDGIYLHYSNENIYSTILTDIDFELVGIQNSYYTPYKKINITSDRIIEENYSLYLIMKHYIGLGLNLDTFLNYDNRLYLNIASLILLIQSLVTLIIDTIKEGTPPLPIFQIITIISLLCTIIYSNYNK